MHSYQKNSKTKRATDIIHKQNNYPVTLIILNIAFLNLDFHKLRIVGRNYWKELLEG